MGCLSKLGKAVANWIASALQTACAIAIIYYLYQDLYKVDPPSITDQMQNAANQAANFNSSAPGAMAPPPFFSPMFNASEYKETCYLSEEGNKDNACKQALWTVVITFAACIALSIIQCFTCNCCGLGSVFDTILSMCLCALWAWFSVALTKDHTAINDLNPQPVWNTGDVKDARSIVLYLSWAEVALFAFTALIGISGMCGGGDGGDSYKV